MTENYSQLQDTLKLIVAPYKLEIIQRESDMRYIMTLRSGNSAVKIEMAEQQFLRSFYPNQVWIDIAKLMKAELDAEIEEKKLANYPDIREWACQHLAATRPYIMECDTIPGWIFSRWNAAHPGMQAVKEGGVIPAKLNIKEVLSTRIKVKNKQEEDEKVARKVVVQRGVPSRDPSKVKRPKCPVHTGMTMKFNAIRSVWECEEPVCKIVAQPKNEPEQGRVTLGKGDVQLRVICQEGQAPSIVLISDDNIALDITVMVDGVELMEALDMKSIVEAAKESGLNNISIPQKNSFVIRAKSSVINPLHYPFR